MYNKDNKSLARRHIKPMKLMMLEKAQIPIELLKIK